MPRSPAHCGGVHRGGWISTWKSTALNRRERAGIRPQWLSFWLLAGQEINGEIHRNFIKNGDVLHVQIRLEISLHPHSSGKRRDSSERSPFSSTQNRIDFAQGANLYFSEGILLPLSSLDINASVFFCYSEKNEETNPRLFPLFNFDKTIA